MSEVKHEVPLLLVILLFFPVALLHIFFSLENCFKGERETVFISPGVAILVLGVMGQVC